MKKEDKKKGRFIVISVDKAFLLCYNERKEIHFEIGGFYEKNW